MILRSLTRFGKAAVSLPPTPMITLDVLGVQHPLILHISKLTLNAVGRGPSRWRQRLAPFSRHVPGSRAALVRPKTSSAWRDNNNRLSANFSRVWKVCCKATTCPNSESGSTCRTSGFSSRATGLSLSPQRRPPRTSRSSHWQSIAYIFFLRRSCTVRLSFPSIFYPLPFILHTIHPA